MTLARCQHRTLERCSGLQIVFQLNYKIFYLVYFIPFGTLIYVNKCFFFYRNIPNYVELAIVKGEQPQTHPTVRIPANELSHDVTSKMALDDVTNVNKVNNTEKTCPERLLCSSCKPDVADDVKKNIFKLSRANFLSTSSNYLSVSTWSSRVTAV